VKVGTVVRPDRVVTVVPVVAVVAALREAEVEPTRFFHTPMQPPPAWVGMVATVALVVMAVTVVPAEIMVTLGRRVEGVCMSPVDQLPWSVML
jgi:hypothetical protein